jgi:transposase-like protein
MSVAEYAGHLGVSVPTLYQWRRRLGTSVRGTAGGGGHLVEVTLARTTPTSPEGMVVRLCGGRRAIEVRAGFDADELLRLLEVVESC